jgi:anti-sigma factor RsiW
MIVSCAEFREDISSLLDGELEPGRQALLSEHVSSCSNCRSSQNQYKSLGLILKRQKEKVQATAPDLWSNIAAQLPSVCECVRDDLSAYLDGELSAPAKEGVSAHLEACSPCFNRFQQLSKLTGLLSKGLIMPDKVAADVDIWPGLKSRLNEDCLLIKTELSAFVDKEVNTLRHRTITQHLTECEDCTRDFSELSQTGDVLRAYYQPSDLENINVWPALESRLKVVPNLNLSLLEGREKKRIPQPVRRLYAVAAVVAAGALATSTYLWFNNVGGPAVQPVTAEAYLIDQSLGDPADVAEAVVYDHSDD